VGFLPALSPEPIERHRAAAIQRFRLDGVSEGKRSALEDPQSWMIAGEA